jgi:hypothetical protein
MKSVLVALWFACAGCRAMDASNAPDDSCRNKCKAQVKQCSKEACERGCLLILDRILEHEDARVMRCMASRKQGCGDELWASCGARIGPHVDGGPPAPPAAKDYEDDE